MISIDEFEEMLRELAQELPEELFLNLNGGILLLPEAKRHPEAVAGELYIMGEYHVDGVMGRYIAIYYGSFGHVYGALTKDELRLKVEHTLKHEFRHHLESQGGDRDLEVVDEQFMQDYHRRHRGDKV